MAKVYFSFAVADSMFPNNRPAIIHRINIDAVGTGSMKEMIESVGADLLICANPSHKPTFVALEKRFGISITPPEKAATIALESGDVLLVASIRGLPRMDGTRHEYTDEEVDGASFNFSMYTVE